MQKNLKITGNLYNDLERLTEAYANCGWYYNRHILHGLNKIVAYWQNLLDIVLESNANGSNFWESQGQYIKDFDGLKTIDFVRKTTEKQNKKGI